MLASWRRAALALLIGVVTRATIASPPVRVDLQGEWRCRLDPEKVGVDSQWFKTVLPERIRLPGSTDENGFGQRNDARVLDKLSRPYLYTGPAWYQRDIEIPEAWRGWRVTLFLERCHWETRAWVDDQPLGMRDSLCVPHMYELAPAATPGRHRLTLRVDNTMKYNVGAWAHSVTDETQTNWNGIIGLMELRATPPVWIDDVQVYPDLPGQAARVRVRIGNNSGQSATVRLSLEARARGASAAPDRADTEITTADAARSVELDLRLASRLRTWDEFSPALYDLNVRLEAAVGDAKFADERTVTFGMRQLTTRDMRILLNGRPLLVRGTLECCIFPLTGYPPTDRASWARIIGIARSYGLNHLRFHSWCPPEAAFAAADEAGFTFHVEAPQWVHDIGKDAARDAFIAEEARRILDTYGNHPSLAMFCLGNELGGDVQVLYRLVKTLKEYDRRHLYASATAWVFGPDDDYAVPYKNRGIKGPGTDQDFRELVAEHQVPCITHELGQWTVFPNLAEIPKYTGVLKPRNFEMIRESLAARQLLEQAPQFTLATGRQMIALYKEEIESQLRTPNSSGFQLLDLHDFPGQSTALVGTLDAFWDSKGLITPEAFRRFCGPTVPLLRMKKRVYTAQESFRAEAELAHFGAEDLPQAEFEWTIRSEQGDDVARGHFAAKDLPTGTRSALGRIETSFRDVNAPARLTVTVALPGTPIGNDWDIWVYPDAPPQNPPAHVTIATAWDGAARAALAAGRDVLLVPDRTRIGRSLAGSFLPPFWTPLWNKHPLSMSILCDPKHPALARFPTDMYTNWQWYDLLKTSRSMILDDLPPTLKPIVQVIDVFPRNHRLANLWEARAGGGRLVVCSLDVSSDLEHRPVARQMRASILAYMGSAAFQPAQQLPIETVNLLFPESLPAEVTASLPAALARVRLRVVAAGRAPSGSGKWSPAADEVLARAPGFDYRVEDGNTWRDPAGTAWTSGRCAVVVTCPKDFSGSLLVRLDDWNNQNRTADMVLNERLVAVLDRYNQGGRWVRVPIAPDVTGEGSLHLAAESTAGPNAMITELIVAE